MSEWLYILLGFLAGVVFSVLVAVSVIKKLFNIMIERENNNE